MNFTLDWTTLAQIIRESIFLGVLLMGWKKMWVFGWLYIEAIREKNAWRRMALRGTNFLEYAAELEGSHSTKEEQ